MKRMLAISLIAIGVGLVAAGPANAAAIVTVELLGGGQGHVTAPRIDCRPDCVQDLDFYFETEGQRFADLTATADPGSIFAGWGGVCAGAASTCAIGAFEDKTMAVTARFERLSVFGTAGLTVAVAGSGAGSIAGPGITCPGDCSQSYIRGAKVTLTATPAAGSRFAGWSGACSETAPKCTLTMAAGRKTTATFAADRDPGAGSGPAGTDKKPTSRCTIRGTARSDLLVGTRRRDVICGGAGNDRLRGLAGADVLIGGRGADILRGGRGRDLLYARDRRRDRVNGGAGTDRARVDVGTDTRRSIESAL